MLRYNPDAFKIAGMTRRTTKLRPTQLKVGTAETILRQGMRHVEQKCLKRLRPVSASQPKIETSTKPGTEVSQVSQS